MTRAWTEIEAFMPERAYRTLERDPQVLLERDGGPVGLDADLFHARLLGFEDEIVTEMWVRGAEPTILMPILRRPVVLRADAASLRYEMEPSRVARYELQSGFVTLSVSAEYDPPVERLRPDFTARVAYLRYRRRS